jgi:hypothetical protein
MPANIPDLHVVVQFGKGIPSEVQGEAMLAFEKKLRDLTHRTLWIEVFKDAKGDDSKLRANMTKEQRAAL